MPRYDAIVVGAGPAGSTAAYRLAGAGASVLLLDRARFPRDKPCGGGVTIRALRQLPFAIDPVVEDVVDSFELRIGHGHGFERTAGEPLALMTQRRRLDLHLVERAVAAGAELRDGVKVTRASGTAVVTHGGRLEGTVLIAADGANGVVARSLGLAVSCDRPVALEGSIPYGPVARERYTGRLVLEFATVPGGYGWVFPKGDHVNVGVGGWASEGPRLREHLARLCAAHRIDPGALQGLRGHRLPLRRPGSVLAQGRVALVGDAAGLIDPLSGDGMYEAFLSARLASEQALAILSGEADGFEPYAERLEAELGPLVHASWGAKRALDRFPRLVFTAARTPYLWDVVVRLMRGEIATPGQATGPARVPLNVLRRLAQAAH